MREIEVKARLRDIEQLLEKASAMGIVFSDPVIQEDSTYETDIPKSSPNWNIFRIRKQDDKIILTMKYKASSRLQDNHERETTVGDAAQVTDMLSRVGYHFGVRIRKARRTAAFKDVELCIDEIDELGSFIEVEKLADDQADVDKIQAELWNLLLSLGATPTDRVYRGYDILMRELIQSRT